MEAGTPDLIKLEDLEAACGPPHRPQARALDPGREPPGRAGADRRACSAGAASTSTPSRSGRPRTPTISRITLTLDGAVHPIDQVTKQLHKLVNVIKIRDMEPGRDDRPGDGAVQGLGPGREPRRDHAVRRDLPGQDRRRLAPLADDRGHRQRRQDRGLRADDPPARADRDGAHGRGRDRREPSPRR